MPQFCLISSATNTLEAGWDILPLKGGIHSSIWNTKNISVQFQGAENEQIEQKLLPICHGPHVGLMNLNNLGSIIW